MRKSNSYLYDTEDVPEIPKEVVDKRLKLLNTHLDKLLEVHYVNRNGKKVGDVMNAISFWEGMK